MNTSNNFYENILRRKEQAGEKDVNCWKVSCTQFRKYAALGGSNCEPHFIPSWKNL